MISIWSSGRRHKPVLDVNPGWDSDARKLATFTDVCELQRQLKALGVQLASEAAESTAYNLSSGKEK
jgi:hypothetical protein